MYGVWLFVTGNYIHDMNFALINCLKSKIFYGEKYFYYIINNIIGEKYFYYIINNIMVLSQDQKKLFLSQIITIILLII
jgi:hypothetical protein